MDRRLGINIIPSSSWFVNLRSVLPKDKWDSLRKSVYRNAKYRCEVCGGRGDEHPIECHEVWEFDEANRVQKLKRLIGLCPLCHKCQHPGLADLQGYHDVVIQHYSIVNKISKADAEKDYGEAWKVWQKRCEIEWDIDISVLDEK